MSKNRIVILLVVFVSISAVVMSEPPPTESLSSEDALAEYLRIEKAAKLECIKRMDAARSAALAEKKTEKAREIFETKQALLAHDFKNALHPFVSLRNEIKSTKWHNVKNAKLWNRFQSNFELKNSRGDEGNWAVVDTNAIVSTPGESYIHLWEFDEKRNKAVLKRFKHDTRYKTNYVRAK